MTTSAASKYNAPWIASLAIQLPLASPPWVKVLPLNDEVGRPYLLHNAYIHDAQLPIQIPLETTHLAYAPDRAVPELEITPISRWWGIGSAVAIPSTGITNHRAITNEPNVLTYWDTPATLVELDPDSKKRLRWSTGYKNNGDWRRLDCGFPLADVITAIQNKLSLNDLVKTS